MKVNRCKAMLAFVLVLSMLFPAFAGAEAMTEVGTPRAETLIVDMMSGRDATPDLWNWYLPGVVASNHAGPWMGHHMWNTDTASGEVEGELADGLPTALDDTLTKFEVKIREGLKWSDGVDFTANDVVFTGEMLASTTELGASAQYNSMIKSMTLVDDYTIQIETNNPEPKLELRLGSVVHGNFFKVVPKHVWEGEDPTTFRFSNPIGLSAYKYVESDPQGYWHLYEKREDWQYSLEGQKIGEPAPKYILQRAYGTEDKRVMAAIQHELDIMAGVAPESWDMLNERDEYAQAWFEGFPYANFDNTCERGILFNNARAPYDNKDVRWALALSVDIIGTSMNGYNGMQNVSPIQVPPTSILTPIYHIPMRDWLTEYAFEDGYKPFDATIPMQITEEMQKQGIEGLPETEEEMINTFGIGWWKYDTDKATEMLEANGFKLENGEWYLPDGSRWTMELITLKEGQTQQIRLGFAAAESWRKFGIDVNVIQLDSAAFNSAQTTGEYQVITAWPACGMIADVSTNINTWSNEYLVPIGENASANVGRWDNQEATDIINELLAMPRTDEKMVSRTMDLLKIMVDENPNLVMYGAATFTPYDTYYWEGMPDASNSYAGPWQWWSNYKYVVPKLQPTGRTE